MGYYINPPNITKEQFLEANGVRTGEVGLEKHDFSSNTLPVCLVDNRDFTAAGICYDPRELKEFLVPDGRKKQWFLVLKTDLKPYYWSKSK